MGGTEPVSLASFASRFGHSVKNHGIRVKRGGQADRLASEVRESPCQLCGPLLFYHRNGGVLSGAHRQHVLVWEGPRADGGTGQSCRCFPGEEAQLLSSIGIVRARAK